MAVPCRKSYALYKLYNNSYFRLAEYQHHYWKDFPENSLTGPTHSQLTPDLLSRLNLGNIPGSPSCIHSHLLDIQLKQVCAKKIIF